MKLISFRDSVFASDKIERVTSSEDDDGKAFVGITTVSGDVMSWEYDTKEERNKDYTYLVTEWRYAVEIK